MENGLFHLFIRNSAGYGLAYNNYDYISKGQSEKSQSVYK